MLNLKIHQSRFSLYYLDEGEMYIKEFASICQFLYPPTNKIEQLKGNIHFGSRSIIFEPSEDEYQIVKFHFRNFIERPKIQNITNKEMFKFKVNRIILIPTPPKIEAYKIYDLTSDIIIDFLFEKTEYVAEIIFELIDKFNAKQSSFEFDSITYLGNLYSFQFDYTLIKTINEKFLLKNELIVKQLLPLLEIPGMLMLTDTRLYFQPVFTIHSKKCISVKYTKITKFFKREVSLDEKGLELITNKTKTKSIFIIFENESNRDMIYDLILKQTSLTTETNFSIEKYTKLWIEGGISNYDYIILLNSAANRTRNDMSQYPVFPWIISNYTSNNLDLTDEKNFRDLSKPIGAINPERLNNLKERFRDMPEPKFLYGTHYSNPAYVIGYLVRKHPEFMLKLHSGKFDHPDRLFFSIKIDWDVCNTLSVKELIPEFYEGDTEFLMNEKKIEFGLNSQGEKIDNVILPPWAVNQNDFLEKMREALECEYVNKNLNKWIDLIFGYKQRGKFAIESDNLFHPLCYDHGKKLLDENEGSDYEKMIRIQINEFGQVPKQLFREPHPKKFSNTIRELNPIIINDDKFDEEEKNEEKNSDIENNINVNIEKEDKKENEKEKIEKEEKEFKGNFEEKIEEEEKEEIETIITYPIYSKLKFNYNKNFLKVSNFHKKKITSLALLSYSKLLITGSEDGYIRLYDYDIKEKSKEFFISDNVTSIVDLNNSNLFSFSYGNKIDIINCQLGKSISSFYGSETKIKNLFSNPNNNFLICDSEEGILNIWDTVQIGKVPLETIFFFEQNKIIDSFYNIENSLYYCLDDYGYVSINHLKTRKDKIYKGLLNDKNEKNKPLCICNDYSNINQFIIGYEKGIKIFDLRNFQIINEINEGENIKYLINDTQKFIMFNNFYMDIYNYNYEKRKLEIREKLNNFGKITYIKVYCISSDNIFIFLGNENGDLFYFPN